MVKFLSPDYLVPPPLAEFWSRYLALVILTVGLFVLLFHNSSWVTVNAHPPSVQTFGLKFTGPDLKWVMNRGVDSLSLQDFANFVFLIVATGIEVIYLFLEVTIYGWKRWWESLRGRGFRHIAVGIFSGTAIWVGGGFLARTLGL